MKRRILAVLLVLLLCGSLALSVSADIVMEPYPAEDYVPAMPIGLGALALVLIVAAVLVNAVAALVLILVFVKKKNRAQAAR